MKSFVSILREPDRVFYRTDDCPSTDIETDEYFEGAGFRVRFEQTADHLAIILDPPTVPVQRIKLRWKADFRFIHSILQDAWCVALGDLAWNPMTPQMPLPWYFLAYDGERTHGYGVKTGCNAFCFWQADADGVSLWLDVRNGGNGVLCKEPLTLAYLVEREGQRDERSFVAAQAFCEVMCPHPVYPKRPVFGLNNWYYAYGRMDRNSILEDTALCRELTVDCTHAPYMVIDDGWEKEKSEHYNGGPFFPAKKMGDMATLADQMKKMGVIPGIWIRPMLTTDVLPEDCYHPAGTSQAGGRFLNADHPQALFHIESTVQRMVRYGYRMIKHDFTCPDYMGKDFLHHRLAQSGWHFEDRSKTNAQILKNLYRVIQNAAAGADVIGCNTYNHLAAGIHPIQRSGADTSGRVWEITRKLGINTMAFRLYQNNRFFRTDADCPAFTEKVPTELNMRFLELACKSGAPIFASITPGLLTNEQKKRAKAAFAQADAPCGIEPLDWHHTTSPTRYLAGNDELTMDWTTEKHGVTMFYSWTKEE